LCSPPIKKGGAKPAPRLSGNAFSCPIPHRQGKLLSKTTVNINCRLEKLRHVADVNPAIANYLNFINAPCSQEVNNLCRKSPRRGFPQQMAFTRMPYGDNLPVFFANFNIHSFTARRNVNGVFQRPSPPSASFANPRASKISSTDTPKASASCSLRPGGTQTRPRFHSQIATSETPRARANALFVMPRKFMIFSILVSIAVSPPMFFWLLTASKTMLKFKVNLRQQLWSQLVPKRRWF